MSQGILRDSYPYLPSFQCGMFYGIKLEYNGICNQPYFLGGIWKKELTRQIQGG